MATIDAFPDAVRGGIRTSYLRLLEDNDSPLLRNPQIRSQLIDQLDSVLDAVAHTLRWRVARPTGLHLSAEIGDARARSGASPAQSLKAASLIFQSALPAVTQRLHELDRDNASAEAAVALNAAILDRMAAAALSYVDVLLSRAQTNGHVERRRLSRELHDVAAPSVALALQSLELHDVYLDDDPARAAEKLSEVRASLQHALTQLRDTAKELHDDVAATGLTEALRRYVDSFGAVSHVSLRITEFDRLLQLSAAYSEETFLIIREAIRNAVTHSHARRVEVSLSAVGDTLQASVADDGRGFDPIAATTLAAGVGLASMSERADLLSATLRVESNAQAGSTVRLSVPLPRRPGEASKERPEP